MISYIFSLIIRLLPIAVTIGVFILRRRAAKQRNSQRSSVQLPSQTQPAPLSQQALPRTPEWPVIKPMARPQAEPPPMQEDESEEEDDFSAWSLSVDEADGKGIPQERPAGRLPDTIANDNSSADTEKPVFPVEDAQDISVRQPAASLHAPAVLPNLASLSPWQQAVVMTSILGRPPGFRLSSRRPLKQNAKEAANPASKL